MISRAEIAKVIIASLKLEPFEGESFSDVDENSWASAYINAAKKHNYIGGYVDGEYRPELNITRAEFATIMYRTVEDYIPENFKLDKHYSLKDIEEHWAKQNINALNKLGAIRGYSDKNFRPDDTITRAEAVVIVNRIQGRIPDREKIDNMLKAVYQDENIKSHWAYYDIVEASVNHEFYIITDKNKNQMEFWTRFYF